MISFPAFAVNRPEMQVYQANYDLRPDDKILIMDLFAVGKAKNDRRRLTPLDRNRQEIAPLFGTVNGQ